MEILSSNQAYEKDQLTIKTGVKGETLMENAGKEAATFIKTKFPKKKTLILCGPGNNGGDGFVIARHLKESGWEVDTASMIDKSSYKNDAKIMANKWDEKIIEFEKISPERYDLIVDAIFGIGLSKNIESNIASIIKKINDTKTDTVAIDIPTGINCDNGEVLGIALKCKYTVTFARKKFGHVIYPGKDYCGEVHVADIGIKEEFLKSDAYENLPKLWLNKFPFPTASQHKYSKGHSIVLGGGSQCTGAATLSATSALVSGSGLVTVACPKEALSVYASKLTSVMNKPIDSLDEFKSLINDKKITSVLIGPGCGVNKKTKEFALCSLALKKNCVLDADALTVFQEKPNNLFDAINSQVVLTPHEGEFKRLFSIDGSKIQRASKAAKLSNSIVVLKGADTIIASPDGKLAINTNAPPTLATAGSGDVLAGIITGLLANNMDAFNAACAGVWIHGQAANHAGLGLISEDLVNHIPNALKDLAKIHY